MSGYWRDDMADALRNAILADWCDELEDWRVEQVQAALRQWRRENPNKRPNPGHISQLLKLERGKAFVARQTAAAEAQQTLPAPGQHHETAEERRVSAESARAIMADVLAGMRSKVRAEEEAEAARRASAYPVHTQRPEPEIAAE